MRNSCVCYKERSGYYDTNVQRTRLLKCECDTITLRQTGYRLAINPLTTDDECTHHATLTACYQLKIGSALAERVGQGEVGGHSHDMPCTWRLSWLAIEKTLVGTGLALF